MAVATMKTSWLSCATSPDYFNPTMAELPRGDFAFTSLRNALLATLLKHLWQRLQHSSDSELAAIAGKALKEARYHQQHYGDWVARLGDGTRRVAPPPASGPGHAVALHRRVVQRATRSMKQPVPVGLGPDAGPMLRGKTGGQDVDASCWLQLQPAGGPQRESAFRSTGKAGRHSEHMGYILAEMQHLQRSYPGGAW